MKDILTTSSSIEIIDRPSPRPHRCTTVVASAPGEAHVGSWHGAGDVIDGFNAGMTTLNLFDGTTCQLPRELARPFTEPHPDQTSMHHGRKILAIGQPEMRLVVNFLLYHVLPELTCAQTATLSRIAATYGLASLGAVVGSSSDEKIECFAHGGAPRAHPHASWIMQSLTTQGFRAEAKRTTRARYSVVLPASTDIRLQLPRHQLGLKGGAKTGTVGAEVWLEGLRAAHNDEAERLQDLIEEAEDICLRLGWRHRIDIRLVELTDDRLAGWMRGRRKKSATFRLSAATAEFDTRALSPKGGPKLLT